MESDPGRTGDDASFDTGHVTDGGTDPGFDEAVMYTVIRAAMKDALLDVIGTVLLVGTAFVIVVAGGQALVDSESVPEAALAGLVALFGVYMAAATLEIVPPIRDWF